MRTQFGLPLVFFCVCRIPGLKSESELRRFIFLCAANKINGREKVKDKTSILKLNTFSRNAIQ